MRVLIGCSTRVLVWPRTGIADRPGDMPDIFHTFFGLAGLSLLGDEQLQPIDPVYALPITTLRRMGIASLYSVRTVMLTGRLRNALCDGPCVTFHCLGLRAARGCRGRRRADGQAT